MKGFAILILIFLVAWGSFFFLAIEISQNVGGVFQKVRGLTIFNGENLHNSKIMLTFA